MSQCGFFETQSVVALSHADVPLMTQRLSIKGRMWLEKRKPEYGQKHVQSDDSKTYIYIYQIYILYTNNYYNTVELMNQVSTQSHIFQCIFHENVELSHIYARSFIEIFQRYCH